MFTVAQPSLALSLDNNIFFLHPTVRPEIEPAHDPVLHGILRLNLPVRKEIKSVTVRLEGCYSLSIPFHPLESGKILTKEINIDCRNVYEKGEHLFEFSFVIPSSTPPYERSRYGRVYHRVAATVKGAGLFGGDLTVEKPIDIVVNPAPEGEVLDMDVRIEGYEEALGPYVVALRSHHLTVGGLLRASLHLSDPPPDIKIHGFSVFVIQKTTLTSRNNPKVVCQADPQRHVCIRLDKLNAKEKSSPTTSTDKGKSKEKNNSSVNTSIFSSALGLLTPPSSPPVDSAKSPNPFNNLTPTDISLGDALFHRTEWGALSTSRVVRLPSDSTLRPSTHPGTKEPPIRNHNEIEIRFRYELPHCGRRVFTVARDIQLSSCCCRLESIVLPSYEDSQAAEKEKILPPFIYDPPCAPPWTYVNSPPSHVHVASSISTGNPCVCGSSAEYLLNESSAAKSLLEELASELEREFQPPVRRTKSSDVSQWAAAAAATNGASIDIEMAQELGLISNGDIEFTRQPPRNRSFPF